MHIIHMPYIIKRENNYACVKNQQLTLKLFLHPYSPQFTMYYIRAGQQCIIVTVPNYHDDDSKNSLLW